VAAESDDRQIKVMYDGWPLVYAPLSPAALHLMAILELHPPDIRASVGLPGEPFHLLPGDAVSRIYPAPPSAVNRLRWEQQSLPGLARASAVDLIHLTVGAPALGGKLPVVVSPTAFTNTGIIEDGDHLDRSWAARLRQAAGFAGLRRARRVFWPADLPELPESKDLEKLPGIVHPLFSTARSGHAGAQVEINTLTELEIPETYVLYHGPYTERDLRRLFTAWSWAAGPVGDQYPLLLAGTLPAHLAGLVEEFKLGESVRSIPAIHLPALAALYRGCSALFHPAPLPAWGDPVRMALACCKPVVALESPRADALVGPAAYLAVSEPGERLLGSALISVIVEESLAERLSQAARQRQAGWDGNAYTRALGEAYRSLV
jgi:hypothetical protein